MYRTRWFQSSVFLSCGLIVAAFFLNSASRAHTPISPHNFGPSGRPLPRFVSIKPSRVNVRIGPGSNYTILFTYQRQGLPIEIIQEYDQWRKIRDPEGNEGWIYQSLLSGKRTAITIPWQKDKTKRLMLRQTPTDNAALIAEVEPNVIGNIRSCDGRWCELDIHHVRGWLHQAQLWGIYPDEKIKK